MITALALAAILTCQAGIATTFETTKAQAVKLYPQHAADLANIKASFGTPSQGRTAEVIFGGQKIKAPKGWGFIPTDYAHRITFDDAKMCGFPEALRAQVVRHEVGHVIARKERGNLIVDEEAAADEYANTLETLP